MSLRPDMCIGVDLDNTLAIYGDLLHQLAVSRGLVTSIVKKDKTVIRDKIRKLVDGEIEWQKLQSDIYGSAMVGAELADGADCFFRLCARMGVRVCIVSHRTRYPNYGGKNIDLHQAATSWMENNHFFSDKDWMLTKQDVFFELSRKEKLKRIKTLGCTHFVDDLEEVLLEDSFPRGVYKILYSQSETRSNIQGVPVANTWYQVNEFIFGTTGNDVG